MQVDVELFQKQGGERYTPHSLESRFTDYSLKRFGMHSFQGLLRIHGSLVEVFLLH